MTVTTGAPGSRVGAPLERRSEIVLLTRNYVSVSVNVVIHTCHAKGCANQVQPRFLMCYSHWIRVPKRMQTAVWDAYVPGQEVTKDPSPEWHAAADAAINYVAQLERK